MAKIVTKKYKRMIKCFNCDIEEEHPGSVMSNFVSCSYLCQKCNNVAAVLMVEIKDEVPSDKR